MNNNKTIQINALDNVIVALTDLKSGEKVQGNIILVSDIPVGHKTALKDINIGDKIIKYGEAIGIATSNIKSGEHVHTHNVKTTLDGDFAYKYHPIISPITSPPEEKTFEGYIRDNGTAGTRNDIWIIPTVGCVNKTAEYLAKVAKARNYEGIDEVLAISHPYGCSQMGDDHETTKKLLAALTKNPNVGGALILSLGCENNTIDGFKEALGDYDASKIAFLVTQNSNDEIAEGIELLDNLAKNVKAFRKSISVSKLTLGLKCGGSDAFSGITANPLLGLVSNIHISHGGKAILTEIPETFGAEHLLMNRAENEKIFNEIVSVINDFKDYYTSHNQVVYENPSPGNKDGGITTLEEKSLGCITKGGENTITAVYPYATPIKCDEKPGLILLNGPGNDIVATTALTAIGANIILFTTGRGTPLGGLVPTMKISTNTPLWANKPNWIDFNAGVLLDDNISIYELAEKLYDEIIDIASGKLTQNEINGYQEIAIWKEGVTL